MKKKLEIKNCVKTGSIDSFNTWRASNRLHSKGNDWHFFQRTDLEIRQNRTSFSYFRSNFLSNQSQNSAQPESKGSYHLSATVKNFRHFEFKTLFSLVWSKRFFRHTRRNTETSVITIQLREMSGSVRI